VHQALLKYTVMRLVILVVVLIVLDLIMGPSLIWLALGAVISMALSYLLLRKPREQVSQAIVERTERRLQDRTANPPVGLDRSDDEIEDEVADAIRAQRADASTD